MHRPGPLTRHRGGVAPAGQLRSTIPLMGDCTCSIDLPVVPGAVPSLAAAATEPLSEPFPVPAYPPASWFTDRPDWLVPGAKLAVADDGRVAGYFYDAGQCLVHDRGACPKPSPTEYAAFHQQDVAVDDGTLLKVGVIGNVGGHASPYADVTSASEHYANPNLQLMSCRAYDDEHGGFILGAMVPAVTYGDVALVRRSALSGDWRPMPDEWWRAHGIQASVVRSCEGYDCIGPTLVTRPGLPLVTRYPRAAALGGLGGIQLEEPMPGETTIDLGNGVTVKTTNLVQPNTPPGPHPARTAASPPGAPPAADNDATTPDTPAEEEQEDTDTEQRLAALESAVSDLQGVVGQLIDAVSAPMAAAAELPPAE
jgi:hypothetical protein